MPGKLQPKRSLCGLGGHTWQLSLTLAYNSHGTASYGSLSAFVSGSLTGAGAIPGSVLVSNNPSFEDVFTFSWRSPPASTGTAFFRFSMTGTQTASAGNLTTAGMRVIRPGDPPKPPLFLPNANGIATSPPVSIVAGQPIDLTFLMVLDLNLFTISPGSSGQIDFSHTSVLDGINIVDANGNPISQFSIVSGSGTAYNAAGVAPEPGTWMLLGVGMAVIAIRRNHTLT